MNIRFLLIFLTLVVGVNAQTIEFTLPAHPEDSAKYLLITVSTAEGVEAGHSYDLTYSEGNGPFLQAVQAKLQDVPILLPAGFEDAEFFVSVEAYADFGNFSRSLDYGFRASARSKAFRFEKAGGEWKMPQIRLDLGEYPELFFFYRPTATAFEIRTQNAAGQVDVFSTKTMVNTFTNLVACNLPSATNSLTSGFVQLLREFVVPTDANRWWTTQEITLWEKPAPRLAVNRTSDGTLRLSATGVKYLHLGMLQESSNLVDWASPPQLLKKSSDSESDFILDTTDGVRFYRLRIEDSEDTLSSQ